MSNGTLEFDLVIKNGKLVIPPDIISSSIGIKGEKIAAIATDLSGFPAKKPSMPRETTSSRVSWTRRRTLASTALWKTISSRNQSRHRRRSHDLGHDADQSHH